MRAIKAVFLLALFASAALFGSTGVHGAQSAPQFGTGGSSADSLDFPIRAAFYYPWFPQTWGSESDPFTHFNPWEGLYHSDDPALIARHVAGMQYAHIQAGIASWWGRGHYTDVRFPALLNGAEATDFRWTVYYEPEGQGDPSVESLRSDLTYFRDSFAMHRNFLRVDDRFVVFVWADAADDCEMASRWSAANTPEINAFVVLKVFSGWDECGTQPDSWHQYAPAVSVSDQAPFSYSISPGFWRKGESEPRLARALSRWRDDVRAMAASDADWHLITTFNEWGEGTTVENAVEWASPSGFGDYLDALHDQVSPAQLAPTNNAASERLVRGGNYIAYDGASLRVETVLNNAAAFVVVVWWFDSSTQQ